ncbi:flagellar basal-body MS-ring/collar protein FliF [Falsirhodobacter sp. 20TX0035]|uniref:flagellar basal-body MS-ring/collar protein FliF n=1 Tax=Falsirhodobacter sp. 20TX0035 TaxID=3022019 RepID=UPI00232FEFFE|nr:flagellar basal-body MS-ring/collar protein FliF [Falsirhodobacter sp. 20TX0035]MDB6452471.1 flagellar basal-body MS-ring/collar protein FliF [Falsirhodobacter sp. 20TX0035]
MQNVLSLWKAMTLARKAVVVGATLAMFAAILILSRVATTPEMGLLYSGLDPQSAGEVVTALEQQGVAYVIEGDSIRVDVTERDRLRMMLASQGLPDSGAAGYEILDGLSGFGTTSQMFDAAYLRAKEGELARTILAMPEVKSARVHIAAENGQVFRREMTPTASVTLTASRAGLTPAQAKAVQSLVAGAVSGMRVEDVAVIDSQRGLIDTNATPPATDRAEQLRQNVERLLAARVGPGHSVVEVAVELETEREQIVERRFDPQGRVPVSQETTEKTSSDTRPSGAVTVASNLPDGDAAQEGGEGRSNTSETQETVNYEVSETQRDLLRQPGDIRKISVAVLVDGLRTDDGWAPRPEEEMQALRDLVASAVGLDEKRGDALTLRSLQFDASAAPEGTLAEAGMLSSLGNLNLMQIVQIGVLALVALILGLFVVRPILTRRPEPLAIEPPLLALPGTAPLQGEIAEAEAVEEAPDPVARLRRLIEARQVESVEVLRGWMDKEERA